MSLPLVDDFLSVVLENRPLLDVRAPVEFAQGAFPHTTNIALLNDEERRLVGIRYKQSGNEAAVKLGRELIDETVQAQRIAAWSTYIQANPDAYLYCFRGGQRSQITQTWLEETGATIPRLKGGYKAFRHFLTKRSEEISVKNKTTIIGGRTGSGKTLLLHKVNNAIDLEAIANHRGSSFGKHTSPQPSQISYENALAYKLIQHDASGHNSLVIEHESRNIGRLYTPKPIFDNFQKGTLVILNTSMEERVAITYEEYVTTALHEYTAMFHEHGKAQWYEDVNAGLQRIQKRLGSERFLKIKTLLAQNYERGNEEGHKEWIEILLKEYYDPMYDYQLKKSPLPIVFEGDAKEVLGFIGQ